MTRATDTAPSPAEIRRRLRRPAVLLAGLASYGLGAFALWSTLGCDQMPAKIVFEADPDTGSVQVTAISGGTCVDSICEAEPASAELVACGTPSSAGFDSWSCGCQSAPEECSDPDQCRVVAVPGEARHCTAHFCPSTDRRTLSVTLASGQGKVESTPGGISLDDEGETGTVERCSGAAISLTRTPAIGWAAGEWTGNASCADSLTLTENLTSCSTGFFQPKLTATVMGSGTITSGSIACREGSLPADCEQVVAALLDVTLTATPDPGAVFQGWGDACTGSMPSFQISDIAAAITHCTAAFSTVAVGAGGSGVIEVISVADNESFGNQASGGSFGQPGHGFVASADLSRVSFRSFATNLVVPAVPPGGNAPYYLRARGAGSTALLSATQNSTSSNNLLSLDAAGRFAAFAKTQSSGQEQVWLLDLSNPAGAAQQISIYDDPADVGQLSRNGGGSLPAISANGRHVACNSWSNLGIPIVAVRDTCFGAPPQEACTPHSVRITNPQQHWANPSLPPRISADGRFVYFLGTPIVSNVFGFPGIFRHDRDTDVDGVFDEAGGTATVLETPDPTGGSLDSPDQAPFAIDASGRYLAFGSLDPDLPGGLSGPGRAAFYRDTCAGAPPGCAPPSYARLTVREDGSAGQDSTFPVPVLSASGRFAAFTTTDSWLVGVDPNDPNAFSGTIGIVRDTCIGASACTPTNHEVTLRSDGVRPTTFLQYDSPIVSADGGLGAFVGPRGDFFPAGGSVRDVLLSVTGFAPELGGTPVIDSRSPVSAPPGSPPFYVTIQAKIEPPGEGSPFEPGAQGLVGTTGALQPRHTVFVSRTRLQVLLDAADLAPPAHVLMIEVQNPGGNRSGAVSFVVN